MPFTLANPPRLILYRSSFGFVGRLVPMGNGLEWEMEWNVYL